MIDYQNKDYKIFDLFRNEWALVTAGNIDDFNCCTVSWGSMGTLWTRSNNTGSTITVYLYPTRLTREYMNANDTFTVSFFSKEYKKALGILGTKSGRDGNKIVDSGLTPISLNGSVGFQEANMIFTCRKIYGHQMSKEDIAQDVQEYYASNPKVYPVDENGDWNPHWIFIGEIIDYKER